MIFRKLKLIAGYIIIFSLKIIIFVIQLFIPINKRIVFIGRFDNIYTGNVKYVFEYMVKNYSDIETLYVINKKMGTEIEEYREKTLLYPSLKCILNLLSAKVLVVDGNEWVFKYKYLFVSRAKKVQLWHGTGMKKIGAMFYKNNNFKSKVSRLLAIVTGKLPKYSIVYFTSNFQYINRKSAFRFDRYRINGQPRNDFIFNKSSEFIKDNKYRKVIMYAPTWRTFKEQLNRYYEIDLINLNKYCTRNNILFVFKLHPKDLNVLNLSPFSNIINYDKKTDINLLFNKIDILITDYSSIYLDFILLNKPIIFFPFDRELYINSERDIIYDYDEITPGAKCYTTKELIQEIDKLINGYDIYSDQRIKIKKMFYDYIDGNSTKRAANDIIALLNGEDLSRVKNY